MTSCYVGHHVDAMIVLYFVKIKMDNSDKIKILNNIQQRSTCTTKVNLLKNLRIWFLKLVSNAYYSITNLLQK